MSSAKIAISLDPEALRQVDQECAKLQPLAEQAAAEEFFSSEAEWPEY